MVLRFRYGVSLYGPVMDSICLVVASTVYYDFHGQSSVFNRSEIRLCCLGIVVVSQGLLFRLIGPCGCALSVCGQVITGYEIVAQVRLSTAVRAGVVAINVDNFRNNGNRVEVT